MSPTHPNSDPDGHWLELLAAYADDELDDATRDRVERWLAAHPEAKAWLRAQQKFSPNNWRLWRELDPPLPSDEVWAAVRKSVAAKVNHESDPARGPERRSRWKWVAGGLAVAATAAALMMSGGTPKSPPPVRPPDAVADDPFGGVAVLPVISSGDVEFIRVSGDAAEYLPVGAGLTAGRLVLASPDDLRIEEAEPSATWPGKMTPGPGDMPMIFASKP